MPQLAMSRSCWQKYDQLEKPIKAGVRKAMEKFRELTVPQLQADKGLHMEQVQRAVDARMRTIRITQSWRGVVLAPENNQPEGTFLLVNVLPHEVAYSKAAKLRFSVNSATGGLEVRNVAVIQQIAESFEVIRQPDITLEPTPSSSSASSIRIFQSVSDTDLKRLGIDDEVLTAARTLTEIEQLETCRPFFPEDQHEVLHHLALGFGVDEVYQDVVLARRPPEVTDTTAVTLEMAIASTTSRVKVFTSSEELREALEQPLVTWKVFLHPSQQRVAYRPQYSGSAQVTGGPGTGKTVVALHRVKHLLGRYPDHRILLTTYTNALCDNLRENLKILIGDEESLARVEVATVNRIATGRLRQEVGPRARLLSDTDSLEVWGRVRDELQLPWTAQFLAQEYQHVLLAHRIRDLVEYQQADRPGRGKGLRRNSPERQRIWNGVQRYLDICHAEGTMTYNAACDHAADLLAADAQSSTYEHVVVDEAQDLHPAQWRLLRSLVPSGPDDLFITGDPHQRIYDVHASLASVGIRVTGRTRRLRINYRSTEEILVWATGILTGQPMGDMGGAGQDSLDGYRSLLHGSPPIAQGYPTEAAEVSGLTQQVKSWLENGLDSADIAVCARFRRTLGKVERALQDAGVATAKVEGQVASDAPGVRLVTTHSMKGLEFRAVAVLGVKDGTFPLSKGVTPAEVDQMQHESDILRERCLLFVACTRARESLAVSWSGAQSPLLIS